MKPHNSNFAVVTLNKPVLWTRNVSPEGDESWALLPNRKYVLCANQLGNLEQHIDSISDIKHTSLYKPFSLANFRHNDTILIERTRERGIGDMLFMTGPMSFLQFISGGKCKMDTFALADRGAVLNNHPALRYGAPFYGPLRYEDLAIYDQHLLIDTVTEYTDDTAQPNVYDAIYATMGIDPTTVPSAYKRPSITLTNDDLKDVDQFFYYTWAEKKVDLRQTGYYVIAPSARGSLRVAPYATWLKVIDELSKRRPVVVVGDASERMPAPDMTYGEFVSRIPTSNNVVNAIGRTPIRVLMSLVQRATAVGCLDSGVLYIAQALRVPAVSIWGPHDPKTRIGYDADYMANAVWNKEVCRHSPCYAFAKFPVDKCPMESSQTVCHPLLTVAPEAIISKFITIEEQNGKA